MRRSFSGAFFASGGFAQTLALQGDLFNFGTTPYKQKQRRLHFLDSFQSMAAVFLLWIRSGEGLVPPAGIPVQGGGEIRAYNGLGTLGMPSPKAEAFGKFVADDECAGASKAEGAAVGAYEGRHFCGVLGGVFGGRAFENPAYERGGEGVSRPDRVLYLGRDGVG